MESEKRIFPGAKVSIPAWLAYDGGEENCEITDVSMNGFFVEIENVQKFSIGTTLKMHLCIDSDEGSITMEFEAEAMRITDNGIGAQIRDIPAESFGRWRCMVMQAMEAETCYP